MTTEKFWNGIRVGEHIYYRVLRYDGDLEDVEWKVGFVYSILQDPHYKNARIIHMNNGIYSTHDMQWVSYDN